MPFSQAYMERTLAANTAVTRNPRPPVRNPFRPGDRRQGGRRRRPKATDRNADKLIAQIRAGLDKVTSLDEDRILRAYLNLVQATLRTNFYQPDAAGKPKSYVSFKFDPGQDPRPAVARARNSRSSSTVHGSRACSLRMGYVARGGIRWSDRREDFRTEVLGLMKAQNVQKHSHRARGRQGWIRSEAPADRRHTGRDAGGGRLLLPDLHPRTSRPD